MGDERAFNPQGGLRGRTNSAGDLATTSTSGGGGAQAGTADWVIFRRRTGVSPYRHSSQQYTASRAPSEHVGAIMNRVTSYLACRVQCATERAIGSPSEATRANNGHILAPCSDPNGRSGPCWGDRSSPFLLDRAGESPQSPAHKMTFMGSGRFRIDLGWLVCTSGGRIWGDGGVSAWGRGERNSLAGFVLTSHLGAIRVASLR